MTFFNLLTSDLFALTWDPQIRGALIFITAMVILPGSVYLLLATNTGIRMGFLLALAGFMGWMTLMGAIWAVYGIGLRGEDPHWLVREVVTGDLAATTVRSAEGFPENWTQLQDGDPQLADAQATADRILAPQTGGGHGETNPLHEAEAARFPPIFDKAEDYVVVSGWRRGGDNALFAIRQHEFFLRHSPHYTIIQVQPRIPLPDIGGAPPTAVADTTQPVTSVVMLRDQGSLRLPPIIIALSSLIIFGVICYVLHQRDKEIWAAKEAEGSAARTEPEREPEPVGV